MTELPCDNSSEHVHTVACGYLNQMEELKVRLDVAGETLEAAYRDGAAISHHDLIALQLRKILELIAFASLSAHREPYIAAYADYAKHWNVKRLLRNLEAINPDFYPKPLQVRKDESGTISFDYVASGYLTRDDFVELYQQTSAVLHVPDPFATAAELRTMHDEWPRCCRSGSPGTDLRCIPTKRVCSDTAHRTTAATAILRRSTFSASRTTGRGRVPGGG